MFYKIKELLKGSIMINPTL